MNWPRIILDGIAMSAVFNAVVLVGFTLEHNAFHTKTYPESR